MAKLTRNPGGLRNRNLKCYSWGEEWPRDPKGYVFLARAFERIGRAICGDRWVESAEALEPEMPLQDSDDETEEMYELACGEAEVEFENMHKRISAVVAEQCEAGNLVSAVRPKPGGRMQLIEPHFWNTEDYGERFSKWHMSSKLPFSLHQQDHWIFVTRESLDDYLSRILSGSPRDQEQINTHPRQADDTTKPPRRSGRTPGSGSFDVLDEPLLKEMMSMIEKGVAKSPHDAAGKVADKAKGASRESKQARLEKKYRARYPSLDAGVADKR